MKDIASIFFLLLPCIHLSWAQDILDLPHHSPLHSQTKFDSSDKCLLSWFYLDKSSEPFYIWARGNATLYSSHNLQDLGYFDQCNKAKLTNKYILIEFSKPEWDMDAYFALCGPSNCSIADYEEIYPLLKDNIFSRFPILQNTTAKFIDPVAAIPDKVPSFYVISAIFVVLFSLPLLATIYLRNMQKEERRPHKDSTIVDRFAEHPGANPYMLYESLVSIEEVETRPPLLVRVLECFDLAENYKDLFDFQVKSYHEKRLILFSGIRVITLFWVVLGVTFTVSIGLAKNTQAVYYFVNNSWVFLVVYGSLYAFDLMLFLNGFFAGYGLIATTATAEPSVKNWARIIMHRVFRLAPAYYVCIIIYWRILPYLGGGPLWYQAMKITSQCDKLWWHNFLLIDNVVDNGPDAPHCFPWGAYVGLEFQLLPFAPLVCWIYNANKKYGRVLLSFLISASLGATLIYALAYEFPYECPPQTLNFNIWRRFYVNPIMRASSYFAGMLLGIMYRKFRHKEEKNFYFHLFEERALSYLISFFGLCIVLLVIFLPRDPQVSDQWPLWFGYFWQVFPRFFFILGVFLFVMPCLIGFMRPLRVFLSCQAFVLFARLGYSAFLLQNIMIILGFYNVYQTTEFSSSQVVNKALAILVLSFAFSGFVSLCVERPFINLEKNILIPKTQDA